jgi:citrate lyase subunit beta/citryl-CoA lyase
MQPAVTYLFVPGDRPDRFAKALDSGADRVILDLEDAVRPEDKTAARQAILAADLDWTRIVIRINDAATAFFAEDLDCIGQSPVAAIMLPKAEDPETCARIRDAADRDVEILPQIETARGLASAGALLSAPGVLRLTFGHLDFSLDLGCAPEWEALLLARSTIVLESRLAGALPPVDSITPDIRDADATYRDASAARALGFGGKMLIHPAQVAPTQRAFAPTEAELDWARRVIAAVSDGTPGAVAVDGKMVDKPVEDAARRILARAGRNNA